MMEKISQIVVAVDASAMTERVLKRALRIGAQHQASLLLIHVLEVPFAQWPFSASVDLKRVQEKLESQVAALNPDGAVECNVLVMEGDAAGIIAVESKKVLADMIVIGCHGKEEAESGYLGSTIRNIVRETHIPVLVVKSGDDRPYGRMIAPTNLTEYSAQSIAFARALTGDIPLKYLYAYDTMSDIQAEFYVIEKDEVEHLRKDLVASATTSLDAFAERAGPGERVAIEKVGSGNDELLEYMEKEGADLVVLGSKGVGPLNSYLFGSTAYYLLEKSSSDVLVYVPSETEEA
jgi:nucleotide-binding universal stress UspA family protein